jgi:hypothetical protein
MITIRVIGNNYLFESKDETKDLKFKKTGDVQECFLMDTIQYPNISTKDFEEVDSKKYEHKSQACTKNNNI